MRQHAPTGVAPYVPCSSIWVMVINPLIGIYCICMRIYVIYVCVCAHKNAPLQINYNPTVGWMTISHRHTKNHVFFFVDHGTYNDGPGQHVVNIGFSPVLNLEAGHPLVMWLFEHGAPWIPTDDLRWSSFVLLSHFWAIPHVSSDAHLFLCISIYLYSIFYIVYSIFDIDLYNIHLYNNIISICII